MVGRVECYAVVVQSIKRRYFQQIYQHVGHREFSLAEKCTRGDLLEYGGKHSAIPLWIVWSSVFKRIHLSDDRLKAELQTKAPSSASLCRRTPKVFKFPPAQLLDLSATSYVKEYFVAMAHVAIGDHDAALELLDKSLAERDPWLVWLGTEAKLDPLRSNPRFIEIFRATNNPLALG